MSKRPSSLPSLLSTLSPDGKDFERLCKWFLENDPECRAEYARVWLWEEWPGRWGRDRGIDLIAEAHDGRIVAVQAKHYAPRHSITKRDVDSFLSESNRKVISARLLVATTDALARSAAQVMDEQEKPVSTCLLSRLSSSPVRWPTSMKALAPVNFTRARPRPHQEVALACIAEWAKGSSRRGQVVMACGTGKSLVAIWAADQLAASDVLVLVPTNALLRQTTREWCTEASTSRRLLQICSDTARNHSDVEDLFRGDELGVVRTTDPQAIAERLDIDDPLLVVCTYDSSPMLAAAMRIAKRSRFDLAVADEAHRCAGLETSSHKTILDEEAIRAERRLFFTATPTVYGTRDKARATARNVRLASMDDRSLFGPIVHHLSFAAAIAQKLLCPYRVAVVPITDDDVHAIIKRRRIVTADGDHKVEAAALATQVACARAMTRYHCRRIVAFHAGVPESKRFSEHFPIAFALLGEDPEKPADVWSKHVDGRFMPYPERMRLIEHFAGDDTGREARILSNVRLLSEGVNVPGIDGIVFVDTHRGQTAVIQAVGRAVRLAAGKTWGTILLPVFLRDGESIDTALARSEHRHIVDVLGALRSHDPDIMKSLDDMRFSISDDRPSAGTGRFVIDAPMDVGPEFAAAVELALANALGLARPFATRKRGSREAATVIEPKPPPTDDQLFQHGLRELSHRGWRHPLPGIPDVPGFPIHGWWSEFQRRWTAGTLTEDDLDTVADSLSWLAPDLDHLPTLRAELRERSYVGLAEHIAAQLGAGSPTDDGVLRAFAEFEPRELWLPIQAIQRSITHAATTTHYQHRRIMLGMRAAAGSIDATIAKLKPPPWQLANVRRAVLYGFAHELTTASTRRAQSPPPKDWTARSYKRADRAGRAAAAPLVPLAQRMRVYRFQDDDDDVLEHGFEEVDVTPDERLDVLGWDIYLLARARGLDRRESRDLAMGGTFAARQRVRRDLLHRSLRDEGLLGGPAEPDTSKNGRLTRARRDRASA